MPETPRQVDPDAKFCGAFGPTEWERDGSTLSVAIRPIALRGADRADSGAVATFRRGRSHWSRCPLLEAVHLLHPNEQSTVAGRPDGWVNDEESMWSLVPFVRCQVSLPRSRRGTASAISVVFEKTWEILSCRPLLQRHYG